MILAWFGALACLTAGRKTRVWGTFIVRLPRCRRNEHDLFKQAKAIMYELAQGNRIEYAYLGITMTTITPDYALQNNLDPNSHQLIPEVTVIKRLDGVLFIQPFGRGRDGAK